MKNKDLENIIRMREIANIYSLTKQPEKSENYHKIIIKLCDRHPKSEEMLTFKIQSLNQLKKTYKTLEAIKELLNLNPYNINALLNIASFLKEQNYV